MKSKQDLVSFLPHKRLATIFCHIVALWCSALTISFAEPLFIRKHITRADGLPSNIIHSIFRDSRGIMWFITDKGVCMYDFNRVYPFAELPPVSLSKNPDTEFSQSLYCMTEDSSKSLWFGTANGAFRYTPVTGQWRRYRIVNAQKQSYIRTIHCDSRGQIWFGTPGGLFYYDKAQDSCIQAFPHIAGDDIGEIIETKNGYLWVKMSDKELLVLHLASGKTYHAAPYSEGNGYYAYRLPDADGIWVSRLDGRQKTLSPPQRITFDTIKHRFVLEKETPHFAPEDFVGTDIYPVMKDREQNWYAYVYDYASTRCENGLYCFSASAGIYTAKQPRKPFQQQIIRGRISASLLDTQSSMLFLGVWGQGVTLLIPTAMERLSRRERIGDVISLLADKRERVWCGTRKGLFLKVGNNFMQIPEDKSKAALNNSNMNGGSTIVYDIQQTSSGTIIAGTGQGLARYNEQTRRLETLTALNNDLGSVLIRHVCSDPFSSELWLAIPSIGIVHTRTDGSIIEYYPYGNGTSDLGVSRVASLVFDAAGDLWMGSSEALLRRRRQTGVVERVVGLPGLTQMPSIYTLVVLRDCTVVATAFGMGWVSWKAIIPHLTQTHLASSFQILPLNKHLWDIHVNSFALTRNAMWWTAQSNGVYRARFSEEQANTSVAKQTSVSMIETMLPPDDGTETLAGDTTRSTSVGNVGAMTQTPQGDLLFDYRGEVVLARHDAKPFAERARVVPLAFFRNDTLQHNIPTATDTLRCVYDGSFALSCAVIAISLPERQCLEYRLEGVDNTWNTMPDATLRTIRYSSLQPGAYRLLVRTRLNNGAVQPMAGSDEYLSVNMLTLTVLVPYPWWLHPVTRGVSVVVLAAMFIGIGYVFQQRRVQLMERRRERELKREQLRREQERLEYENEQVRRLAAEYHLSTLHLQMNPHFFYNMMTVLQNMVAEQNEVALDYIALLARLMRGVLEQSGKPSTSVSMELALLKQYLTLEELRHNGNLKWYISLERAAVKASSDEIIDKNTFPEDTFDDDDSDSAYWQVRQMPSFTLQPFVENAIRHGISLLALPVYGKHREGVITIHIKDEGDFLRCTIEDNGVGRTAAAEFKNRNNGEWRNLSMSTTAIQERLKLLQEAYNIELGIFYEDLRSNDGTPFGTRVTLLVPCRNTELGQEMQPRTPQFVSPSSVVSSTSKEISMLQAK